MTFKLSFNDYYSLDISNKIKAVKHRKQEKGEYIAPYAPFGYKKDPNNKNHLIINEETAPIVKRIFDLYLSGMGTPKITKLFNDEKVPTPSNFISNERYKNCSHIWTKGNIYRILKSDVYVGTIVGHKRYKVSHKMKKIKDIPIQDWIYVEDRHEPIIDKETFNLVQMKLKEPNKCRERQNYNPLKKFIYCGICGRKASMKTGKRKLKSGEINTYHYFVCNQKSENYHNCENGTISSKVLTPIVEKQIKEECSKIIFSKGDLTSLYEEAKMDSNNKKSRLLREIQKNEKEIQQIEKKVEQIYSDKLEGIITPNDFKKFYDTFQGKKEKLTSNIKNLRQELQQVESKKVVDYRHIKKIADECLNMKELKEDLLNKLIERIEYDRRNIKIKYKFMENK